LAYERGDHLVAINLTPEWRAAPEHGALVITTGSGESGTLDPHGAIVARR
ncbi:MAG: hypothetical protein QOE08_2392, partial [Thermoleophilaceae bacterium]|nr:hypothetical protein [Thermoleophilaceae bacterium]